MTTTKTTAPDQPDRLQGQSFNLRDQRLAALKALLPEAFDLDGNLVQDKLLEALKPASYDAADDIPTFGLGWPGKQRAFAAAGVPTTATLRPSPEESIDFDTTNNLLIEGDNLEVLKTLQRAYHGKVKMIYIDPPYNTGKDFVYPDNYSEGLDTYLQRTQQKDEDGFWKSTNSETSGRKHANWLSMMTPRLTLARNLLRDDGVIFISIDDNEAANLRMLCDEVFGTENFITFFAWEKKKKPSFLNKNLGSKYESICVYAKSRDATTAFSVDLTTEGKKYPLNNAGNSVTTLRFPPKSVRFNMPDSHVAPQDMSEGNIKTELLNNLAIVDGRNENTFELKGEWRYSQKTLDEIISAKEDLVISKVPFRPNHIKDGGEIKKMHNLLSIAHYGIATNEDAESEQADLIGVSLFDYSKPVGLIGLLIKCLLYDSKHALVMDFFAGSGTTGHAVMAQNAEDGGNRRYICVQLPEPLDEPVTLDDGVVCKTIFDLTRERLKRAGKKIKAEAVLNAEKLDTGMRVFKLDSSNFTAWNSDPTTNEAELFKRLEKLADHTVPGRGEMDILWEILLKMGLTLDMGLERYELENQPGVEFIGVNDRTRVISTQPAIPAAAFEALLDQDIPPAELVVLDSAFENDTARANIATLYKQRKDEDGKPVCNLKVV